MRPVLIVSVLFVIVIVVAVAAFVLPIREPATTGPASGDSAGAWPSDPGTDDVTDGPTDPTDDQTTPEATPTEDESREDPVNSSPQDSPGQSPVEVDVVAGSDGKPCSTTGFLSDYGEYPLAQCTMWHRSEGLLSGQTLSKGGKKITCQKDLEIDNPAFRTGQNNTWWVWATSDDGRWDWYPETAVAQGVSDQSINGIARCQDDQ